MDLFTRKQGDTAYSLVLEFSDANGPVDLSTATQVMFTMVAKDGSTKVHAAMTPNLDQVNFKGQATYAWQPTDLDTPGRFKCEARATFLGGFVAKWPSSEYAYLEVLRNLAA
jgi:hypothetical protein